MNIAFIVSEFPKLSETFVLNQIVGLLARGHRVDIFARGGAEHRPVQPEVEKYRLDKRTYYLSCPRSRWLRLIQAAQFCARALPAHGRPIAGSLNFFRYGRYALSLSLLFDTIPFYRRYDIVHCHFGPNGLFGATLKRFGLQHKLVVTFHGYDIRRGIERGRAYYQDLWPEADCVMAISPYSYEHLVGLGADPRRIVYHPVGVDLEKFKPRPRPKRRDNTIRLLSVGRLVEEKGFSFAIRAVAQLIQRKPERSIRYEIVGEGPLKKSLATLIRDLDVDRQVVLRGAADRDRVIEALHESEIFLAPSLAEALPVAVMEAHAAGLPVIATRVGSVEQIVQHRRSGFLVAPGDDRALTRSLEILVERRDDERTAMGRLGREHVEQHYDIDRLNDRLVTIYQKLLAASPVR